MMRGIGAACTFCRSLSGKRGKSRILPPSRMSQHCARRAPVVDVAVRFPATARPAGPTRVP